MKDSAEPREVSSLSTWVVAVGSACLLVVSLGLLLFRFSRRKLAKAHQDVVKETKPSEDVPEQKFTRVPVVVLYGTQTGTAEGFAKTISKELRHSIGGKADVILGDIDEYGSSDDQYEAKLKSPDVISLLLLATYGDGEPTDNAARFCRLLARLAEEADSGNEGTESMCSMFNSLTYAVFGLGNRQYEHFNAVAKAVDKQLSALGASRLLEVGLGDDDQCLEDDFENWKASLTAILEKEVGRKWEAINKEALTAETNGMKDQSNGHANGLSNGHALHEMAAEDQEEDEWNATVHGLDVVFYNPSSPEAQAALNQNEAFTGGEHWHGHDVALVPISLVKELHTKASPRSCLHVELDLSKAGLKYVSGDHVAVFPQNEEADVAKAAELLGLKDKLQNVFSLQPHKQSDGTVSSTAQALGMPFASPMRIDTVLRCMLDLHSSPKKAALHLLADHATDPTEAERLRHLASPAGKQEYLEWVLQSHRSLLEVLEAFPSARPPLSVFLTSLAPRLQPRFYSISSSEEFCAGTLSITCSVVDDITPGGRIHHGVCSYFFRKQGEALGLSAHNVTVPVFIRPSTFRLPPSPQTPIIMIGPGTGIAPFRGFLQERQAVIKKAGEGAVEVGPAVLFFGCRTREQDYIYQDELAQFQDSGALTSLHVAFSREGSQKVYVQHLLQEKAAEVWNLWHKEKGWLYVCGDAKHMAKDVHSALIKVAETEAGLGVNNAEALIRDIQQDGRYHRDVW